MFDKLKSLYKKAVAKITNEIKARATSTEQTSMKVVYLYGAGLMLLTVLVLASWCINAWQTGKADTNTLISFFREYTAPAVVAAVTFLSVFFVDKNGDGRPDAAERESENERYRRF